MKAIVKGSPLLTDCLFVFSFAISPFRPMDDDRACFAWSDDDCPVATAAM